MHPQDTAPATEPDSHPGAGVALTLTDYAAEMAKRLMQRDGRTDAALRVSVTGGGCSGFQYDLSFDTEHADDMILDQHGVRIVIDPISAQYLNGTVIDYVSALHGAGFKFLNPNASRTCGCGTSFAV